MLNDNRDFVIELLKGLDLDGETVSLENRITYVRLSIDKLRDVETKLREIQSQRRKQWREGDSCSFAGTALKQPIFAGLFFYSGFGMGDYYSRDGFVYWISASQAEDYAKRDGIDWKYVDSFQYYH